MQEDNFLFFKCKNSTNNFIEMKSNVILLSRFHKVAVCHTRLPRIFILFIHEKIYVRH